MKSLQLTAFAPPAESVRLVEVPGPRPGPDQVLVAVEAAAINPSDFLIITGRYGALPALPAQLGAEGVGVVVEVGSDVDRGRIGERVLLTSSTLIGTWSEQAVVAAAEAVPLGAADPVQLAMLGINPATAYGLLRTVVPLRPGDWVVQTGGNSAVSRTVSALARHYGYRTLSLGRRPAAAEEIAGVSDAVVVIDEHLGENIQKALGGDQAALLLDPIGGPLPADAANAVRPGGTVVTYGAMSGASTLLPPGQLVFRQLVLRGFWLNHWRAETPAAEVGRVYRELAELVDKSVLWSPVEATYPITEFHQALAHAQEPGRTGKVLFRF
jgi:NADPH:quinone reductase-like Zn-dependent oxidoreductase